MRLLLDTHVLLWALSHPAKLTAETRRKINEAEVFVSAASIWEIGIKSTLGKLNATAGEILAAVEPAGFKMLSITGQHAAKAAELPPLHKDPFDRLLAAQAATEPMILITNDRMLEGYGTFVTLI
ncbi:MAG TPA: type II toxin-antitoxin system VapC family toxin [Steroidobacteraceae bacterium]|nr:type II toxin-antitoxin system VapC family toxin [Steroidobacteraceae bacterium]